MTRTTWALLVSLYGLAGIAVLFLGVSIPPCFGDATGHMSAECVARWEAGRNIAERVLDTVGGPAAAATVFLGLTGLTVFIDLAWRVLRRPPGDVRRR